MSRILQLNTVVMIPIGPKYPTLIRFSTQELNDLSTFTIEFLTGIINDISIENQSGVWVEGMEKISETRAATLRKSNMEIADYHSSANLHWRSSKA